jgi:Putative adhesin
MAAITALLALSACGSSETVHDQRVFGFSGARLVIDDSTSDLQVVPGSGPGIQVQRWLSGTAAKPGHSSWTLSGDTLRLGIDCSGLVFRCGSRFQVAVPPGVSVVVHSGDGNDTVSGLSGSVVIEGGSGQVKVSNISGPLKISTREGDITASAIRSPTVRATSKDGNVDIGFAAAPQFVDIKCTDGNARARVPAAGHRYHVVVSSSTGTAQSKVPDDRQSSSVVQVSSINGNATVLPAS